MKKNTNINWFEGHTTVQGALDIPLCPKTRTRGKVQSEGHRGSS